MGHKAWIPIRLRYRTTTASRPGRPPTPKARRCCISLRSTERCWKKEHSVVTEKAATQGLAKPLEASRFMIQRARMGISLSDRACTWGFWIASFDRCTRVQGGSCYNIYVAFGVRLLKQLPFHGSLYEWKNYTRNLLVQSCIRSLWWAYIYCCVNVNT